MSSRGRRSLTGAWVLGAWLGAFSGAAQAQATQVDALRAEAKASPRDFAAQVALARGLLRAGQAVAAERVLTRAKRFAPSDSMGLLRLSEVWVERGDYKRARNKCRALLREHEGKDPVARLCLAKAYLAWNRSSKAFDELEQILQEAPELLEAQLVLGEAHRLRSNVQEAEAAYAAAKRDPSLVAEAELGLGQLYLALGREQEARAALRRALDAEPHLPMALLELGRLSGNTPRAEQLLQLALANRPDWAQAAAAIGDVRLARQDLPGAELAYRQAISADPANYPAYRGLGQALLGQEKIDEAHAALTRGLELFPRDPVATLALGETLLRQGRTEEALKTLRHAADLEPSNPRGLVRAAEVCVQQERFTLAAGYLDRLLASHPRSAAGLALYGDVMRARRNLAKAREYYERALSAEGPLDRERVRTALGSL